MAALLELNAKELWVAFRVGNHFCSIAIHSIAMELGQDKAHVLQLFNAFSGCVITVVIVGKGKRQYGILLSSQN